MIKHDASGFSLVQKYFVKVPLDVTVYVSFPSEYDQCFMFVAQFCINTPLKYQVTHLYVVYSASESLMTSSSPSPSLNQQLHVVVQSFTNLEHLVMP